jgi:hypothetical protein
MNPRRAQQAPRPGWQGLATALPLTLPSYRCA